MRLLAHVMVAASLLLTWVTKADGLLFMRGFCSLISRRCPFSFEVETAEFFASVRKQNRTSKKKRRRGFGRCLTDSSSARQIGALKHNPMALGVAFLVA